MKLARMAEILEAEVLCGHEKLDMDIPMAVASDMMSDVLAYTDVGQVLITGLCTVHTVLTAQILDLSAIVFVRGKTPTKEMIETAAQDGIALLRTHCTMYAACGELYKNGLAGRWRVDG